MAYSPMGAQPLGLAPLQLFGVYPWQAYVQPGDDHWSMPGMHRVVALSATLGRGEPSATHSAVPQPFGGAYNLGGSVESYLIPLPSLHDGEGSSFLGLVPSDDVVNSESVMGIKPGDSSVVTGYQVDEFTHTWFAEQFVALQHQNWTLPWRSLMPFHLLQSLLGFSAWLVPCLIILSCSLLLAFILVNCVARLGLFLPLCLWLPRYQHLN